ncbi:MAG: hypothetical protein GY715_01705 [Planctomycetes bacterium]|nr:hypothetical protein [Planctomycetota bacterium]
MTPRPDDQTVRLPTVRLATVAVVISVIVGGGWLAAVLAGGGPRVLALGGLAAAGAVGVASVVALFAIQPWHERSVYVWPAVWLLGTYIRLVLALAGAFLLYSATPLSSRGVWLAAALTYVAVMVGESRVYVTSMRSMTRVETDPPEDSAPE